MADDDLDEMIADSNESLQDGLEQGQSKLYLGYLLIGAILLLGGAGYLLDGRLGTSPWLLLAGLAAALVIGFYSLGRALFGQQTRT